ncbi:LacI family DNA-binding transcriptional regulator [Cellulomonas endophytica]|uniref:LacI family DNA-binding transcriptional regulator n=1 Tax=Cellulomonas endophytica TaxID=2494735 RepID=UPI0010130190|nr:LacI family DNA-binding transcriptional regulator [Cellulomonas endophytica]
MSDVARAAGVSLGTVSNVLNRPDKVAPATRRRVEDAIATLGFVRNGAARSLAAGRSTTLGFVVADLTNSFFTDMVRGVQERAEAAGFKLLLADAGAEGERQGAYLDLFEEERAAGILLAPRDDVAERVHHVRSRRVPIVLLNVPSGEAGLCAVETDNAHGGYLAAQHLIGLGRRRLLWAGPRHFRPTRERLSGVERAVSEAGGDVTLTVEVTRDVRVEDGRRVAETVHHLPPERRPDGVVAGADLLALGFVQVCQARGRLRIPDDVALVGYDNNREAWSSMVPITTLDQSGDEMGATAADMLLDELGVRGRSREQHRHRTARLEPVLVPRASTLGREG